ncbi:MAG: RagB/SusD family nutrient uptake outer membrane protein [Longimicrobiaceae bacterium]
MLSVLLAGSLFLSGCGDLTVPDFNNPSLEDLENNPTPTGVATATTGLLVGARANLVAPNAYISLLGILGRESYNLDEAEPRFVTEMLVGPMSPSGAFGGNLWTARYANIRNANIILNALDQVGGFSEAEKEAIRGFAKTIQALDYLLVINSRDSNGAVIDVNRPLSEEPGAIEPKEAVFAHTAGLLDEAQGHLQAAGASFPFALSSGFDGFDTPAAFVAFNRALKARVDVYTANYEAALQSLEGSFINTATSLDRGVYHTYGTGSGETPNNLIAATIRAHPSLETNAQDQPGGQPDQRLQDKVAEVELRTQLGVGSDLGFTVYPSNTAPVPVVSNEELILLRAEARWFTDDAAGALQDLNLIRQQAGGLAPIGTPGSDDAFITALLYERTYSLLFEGHRWLDYRRFGRLGSLPLDQPTHTVQTAFPIPEAEQLARQ